MIRPQGDNASESVNAISGTTSVADVTETTSKQNDGSKRHIHRSSASFLNRFEKNKRRFTLQQVIASRQQKLYEQQCEIEELRRRIKEVCTDNKFLREQNYWQGKTLEKLDGRHAELPQIINSHLEEVRVYREQLKRVREVLKIEKQRRHDAEATKDRMHWELRHLRKVAKEQNLLEKEQLVATIEKLRTDASDREKQLTNLGKYAENLEKNQRCESMRSAQTQKEMKTTCQRLLNRIQELEQTIQEKQKVIELSNIYTKHCGRGQSANGHTETRSFECLSSVEAVGRTNSVDRQLSESTHPGYKIRERIKEFDLRRQEMEKKRDKMRKQQLLHENDCSYRGDDGDNKYDDYDDDADVNSFIENIYGRSPGDLPSRPMCPKSANQKGGIEPGSSDTSRAESAGQRCEHRCVTLPKISTSVGNQKTEGLVKQSKSFGGNKHVRFSPSDVPQTRLSEQEQLLFQNLRTKEQVSRRLAEAHIRTNHYKAAVSTPQAVGKTSGQPSQAWAMNQPNDKKYQNSIAFDGLMRATQENKAPAEEQFVETVSSLSDSSQPVNPPDPTCVSPVKSASLVQTASPLVAHTTSDLSTFDSFELTPLSNSMMHICRPCGDQDIDYYLPGDTPTPTPTSTSEMSPGEGLSETDTEVERDPEVEAVRCVDGEEDPAGRGVSECLGQPASTDASNPEAVDCSYPEVNQLEEGNKAGISLNESENAPMTKSITSDISKNGEGLVPNLKQSSRTTTLYAVIKKKLTSNPAP